MSDIKTPVEWERDEGRPGSRSTVLDVYWLICSEEGTSRPVVLHKTTARAKAVSSSTDQKPIGC